MPDKTFHEQSRIDLITVTGILHIGRCILHAVLLAGDGANADCQVSDSSDGNTNEKFHIESLSGTTFGWRSTDGVIFDRGIYITVNASTSHVMIEWHPVKRTLDPGLATEI